MKNFFFVLGILLSTLSSYAQQAATSKLNLEQAITFAKNNHVKLLNADLSIKNSEQEVKGVVATGLPQINANFNFTHNTVIAAQQLPDFISPAVYGVLIQEQLLSPDKFKAGEPQTLQFGAPSSMTGSVSLSQLIFDGTYFLGLKAAKQYVELSNLIKANTEAEIVENVKKSFYGALITAQNAEMLNETLKSLQNTLDETTALYNEGFAEQLDVDRIKLAKSNLQTQITNLNYQKEIMMYLFKLSIGMDVNQDIELDGEIVEGAIKTSPNSTFNVKDRTEYKLLNHQLLLDSLNVKRYKVGYYPRLTFNASYQQNTFASAEPFEDLGKTWNPGSFYSFNLSIPVFDGLYKQSKISQAKLQYEMDQNTLNQTINAMSMEANQAKLNVQIQSNNLANQRLNVELAKSIYTTTKAKYTEGLGSSFEMIQAQTDLIQAEIEESNALYQLILAQIELQSALGTNN